MRTHCRICFHHLPSSHLPARYARPVPHSGGRERSWSGHRGRARDQVQRNNSRGTEEAPIWCNVRRRPHPPTPIRCSRSTDRTY
jgi:hypothetical protein